MLARRYQFYFLVARILHEWGQGTSKILLDKHKIHIFSPLCNILYIYSPIQPIYFRIRSIYGFISSLYTFHIQSIYAPYTVHTKTISSPYAVCVQLVYSPYTVHMQSSHSRYTVHIHVWTRLSNLLILSGQTSSCNLWWSVLT